MRVGIYKSGNHRVRIEYDMLICPVTLINSTAWQNVSDMTLVYYQAVIIQAYVFRYDRDQPFWRDD